MGQKIKSRRLPFANLTNLIVQRERIRLLKLYYPDLQLTKTSKLQVKGPIKATFQI